MNAHVVKTFWLLGFLRLDKSLDSLIPLTLTASASSSCAFGLSSLVVSVHAFNCLHIVGPRLCQTLLVFPGKTYVPQEWGSHFKRFLSL